MARGVRRPTTEGLKEPERARHVQLLVRPGKGHGWCKFWESEEDTTALADWFNHYLRAANR